MDVYAVYMHMNIHYTLHKNRLSAQQDRQPKRNRFLQ